MGTSRNGITPENTEQNEGRSFPWRGIPNKESYTMTSPKRNGRAWMELLALHGDSTPTVVAQCKHNLGMCNVRLVGVCVCVAALAHNVSHGYHTYAWRHINCVLLCEISYIYICSIPLCLQHDLWSKKHHSIVIYVDSIIDCLISIISMMIRSVLLRLSSFIVP